jgi:hypothetical protein
VSDEPLRDRLDREIKFALTKTEFAQRLVTENSEITGRPQDWNRMLLNYTQGVHAALLVLADEIEKLRTN